MKMAKGNMSCIFLYIAVLIMCLVATDAGYTVKSIDASHSEWDKRFEDMNNKIAGFGKELHNLRNTVERQEQIIQEQRILIKELIANTNRNKAEKAHRKQDLEDKATIAGLNLKMDNRTHIPSNKDEFDTDNIPLQYTNVSEKQGQYVENVKRKNEYVALRSLRHKRATAENVAFSFYLDHELTNIPLGTTIICNQVLINDGDGYNTKTGVFTAHVPGVYFFVYSIDSKVIHANVRLMVDGTNLVDGVAQINTMGSNTAIVRLDRGQSVWIETQHTDNIELISTAAFHMVTFSGFLIYQN